jgi:hypothetical protein
MRVIDVIRGLRYRARLARALWSVGVGRLSKVVYQCGDLGSDSTQVTTHRLWPAGLGAVSAAASVTFCTSDTGYSRVADWSYPQENLSEGITIV